MSIVTMIAAHQVVMNGSRGGGGNNGDDGKKSPDRLLLVLRVVLGLIILSMVGMVTVAMQTVDLPSYVVYGKLQSYQTQRYSKSDRVYVNILQTDGKVRQYRTSYHPSECHQRTTTVDLPILVSRRYNEWTKETFYDSQLMLDACAK